MCGIVGFRTENRYAVFQKYLENAVLQLAHRGPDDSGFYFDEKAGIGLGHRRLSILDLSSAGRQPMCSDDRKVWVSYNGEVYNFRKLRSTLEDYGHRFRSNTDTEVVLKAYLQWGIDSLQKFQGMFAMAIWDGRDKKLILARDRIGIKPLYYYLNNGTLLFSSELKALMAFKCFPRDIDPDALPLFLHYQYIPTPRTIFKNTYKLKPGHFLIDNGSTQDIRAYWKLPEKQRVEDDLEFDEVESLQHLDDLLFQSVSDRLISDVPLGALLSGGIDSSIVVALMQKANPTPVRTFSIGFREKAYNEAPWAARVAEHLGTDHTELYVTPKEALAVIPKLPDIYDEPFADSSAIPTYLVSKLTRSQVTVALSGDGGDEQFCGYVRYWTTMAMSNAFQRFPNAIAKKIASLLRMLPVSWVEKCYMPWRHILPQQYNVANFPDKWQKLLSLMQKAEVQELYRMTICLWPQGDIQTLYGKDLPISHYEEVFQETEGWPLLSRLMRVDQKTYLPDAMLTKVDRASMASSLEVRVPLLDHRVLEFTALLPDHLKYRDGTGKYLLKKLLARYLPPALFERPKMGFGVPIDQWFRKELKGLLTDYLSPERLKKEGVLDYSLVEKKVKEHLSGRANHQYRLWSLLMWEMWRERWLGASGSVI